MKQQRQENIQAGSSKKTGQVIVIPKQLRAEWMDVMALDDRLSNFAFRLACVVGTYLNNYSGDTFVSQETIAAVMGVSERTVWGGFAELERFGYLIVKRGMEALPSNRKRRSGGQGVANVYAPAFDKSQISAGYRSEKFAKYCVLIWEKHLINTQKSVVKSAKNCGPTLSDPTDQNSTPPKGPSAADALGPAGVVLWQRLGPDVYDSWFGKVAIRSETPEIVTLMASTRFVASRIHRDYADHLLTAWQAVSPTVKRIEIVVS